MHAAKCRLSRSPWVRVCETFFFTTETCQLMHSVEKVGAICAFLRSMTDARFSWNARRDVKDHKLSVWFWIHNSANRAATFHVEAFPLFSVRQWIFLRIDHRCSHLNVACLAVRLVLVSGEDTDRALSVDVMWWRNTVSEWKKTFVFVGIWQQQHRREQQQKKTQHMLQLSCVVDQGRAKS